jgi:beta-glucosidase
MSAFPDGFIWGVAASAYQIEGGRDRCGRSIWDRFCAIPGNVRNGENAEIACDFYRRYREDIDLMRELGVDAFRFSVSWPRVVPKGRGRVDTAGLDFYDRLVDGLLEAGIEPFATLYHWELPVSVEDAGGWPERSTAETFAEFVEPVAERLGDRVRHWITHNEPWCASWLGYGTGEHAPGRSSRRDAVAASHHVLLSHGLAVEVLRRESPGAEVGLTIDLYPAHAASDRPEDVAAAALFDGTRNRWFLDSVLRGAYPEDVLEHYAADLPRIADSDMETIAAPLDFLGVNNYSRAVLRAADDGVTPVHVWVDGAEHTDMGWEV